MFLGGRVLRSSRDTLRLEYVCYFIKNQSPRIIDSMYEDEIDL